MDMNLLLGGLLGVNIALFMFSIWFNKKSDPIETTPEPVIPQNTPQSYPDMSFAELNEVTDNIISEIIIKKYIVYYELKEAKVIPKMQDDIRIITKEIYESMSPMIRYNIRKYYTEAYFVQRLTRIVQFELMRFIKKNGADIT